MNTANLAQRIARIADGLAAFEVLRSYREWPPGHSECQTRPDVVVEFERRHGPGPEPAERLLREFGESPQ